MSLGADLEWAFYSRFSVGDADSKYRLSVGGYKGNAGSSLASQNGRGWTAPDQDNDAWWAGNCSASNGPGWHKACCQACPLNKANQTLWFGFQGITGGIDIMKWMIR